MLARSGPCWAGLGCCIAGGSDEATRTVSHRPRDAGARRMCPSDNRPGTDPILARFTAERQGSEHGYVRRRHPTGSAREPPQIDGPAPDARCADAASPLRDPRGCIGYETSAPVARDIGNLGEFGREDPHVSADRDCLLDRGDRRDPLSARRAGPHRRDLGLCHPPAASPSREAAGQRLYLGKYRQDSCFAAGSRSDVV